MNADELVQGDVIKFRHASQRTSRVAIIRSVETVTNMIGEQAVLASAWIGNKIDGIYFNDSMRWEYIRNENPEIDEINAEYERLFAQR